jgi:plasmid maintenance system antidote protein VapI
MHIPRMTLEQFMRETGTSDTALAQAIGRDRTFVSRLRRGLVKPSLDTAVAIERFSDGAVRAGDFIPLAPQEAA